MSKMSFESGIHKIICLIALSTAMTNRVSATVSFYNIYQRAVSEALMAERQSLFPLL